MRIDAILYEPQRLRIVEVVPVPELPPGSVIPDATHPSDHFPIKVVFELRSEHDRARELALEWSWRSASSDSR